MEEDKLKRAVLRTIQKLEREKSRENITDRQKKLFDKDEMSCLEALLGDKDHRKFADEILREYSKEEDNGESG